MYRSTLPIWGDSNRRELARGIQSHCLLAAVRSATDPLSIAAHNTQPFRFDQLTFLHNGYLEDFAARWMRPLRQSLSETAYRAVSGVSDSEHVFAIVLDEWLRQSEAEAETRLSRAVEAAVRRLLASAALLDARALLTLVVSDGQQLLAARAAHRAECPTLYRFDEPEGGGVSFASEPLDSQAGWTPIAVGSLCRVRLGQPPKSWELA